MENVHFREVSGQTARDEQWICGLLGGGGGLIVLIVSNKISQKCILSYTYVAIENSPSLLQVLIYYMEGQ